MAYQIRDVREADLNAVLTLNQSEVPHVGSVDLERMQWFAANADYFRVAVDNSIIGAYLIGLRPGSGYQSPNYLWFCERYVDFAYVDRIAVAESARRAGLASRLYADFAASVPDTVEFMTCEVNVRPPNETSMQFHIRLGFEQVGSLVSDDRDKEVAMLARPLR
ncbi:MAG: GNAT family N-acetyltransferase [Woeseiaceae bacterium]|nr:GNAT family N-acetyltransferase [Woeseiaceae bacterium]